MKWYYLTLIVAAAGFVYSGADAQASRRASVESRVAAHRAAGAGRDYYIEFLARPSQYFGHSYVRLGRIDGSGKAHAGVTAGYYPVNADAAFGGPSLVTATRDDLHAKPSVRYRVAVSGRTYRKTSAMIARLPLTWRRYDLVSRNCNHLVGAIAGKIGLSVPGDYADVPESYVRALHAANAGRERASWR